MAEAAIHALRRAPRSRFEQRESQGRARDLNDRVVLIDQSPELAMVAPLPEAAAGPD